MLQAIMIRPKQIKFNTIDIPEPDYNQIRVEIKRIGICGSDIHVYHGKHPYTTYPVVQGHEVSAIIDKVGESVTEFCPGDVVTIQPQQVCKKCYPCTHGMYNNCEQLKVMGFQTTGMASEYFVTEADKILKIPNGITLDQAAMIEPLAVAVHALRRYGDVSGKRVLVLGGGTIGNLVAQTAKALGAQQVLLSEISDFRLDIAQNCGVDTVNPKNADLMDAIINYFGDDRADVIFECVGINETITQAIDCARKGSDIVVVGVFPDTANIKMGYIQDHELRIIGTAMYRVEDFVKAIELMCNTLIELDRLITHRVEFKKYLSAYQIIEQAKDKVMKVMISLDKVE